jgi:hypothetical protein
MTGKKRKEKKFSRPNKRIIFHKARRIVKTRWIYKDVAEKL